MNVNRRAPWFHKGGLLGSGGLNIDLFSLTVSQIHWWGSKKTEMLKSSPLCDWFSGSGIRLGHLHCFQCRRRIPCTAGFENYFLGPEAADRKLFLSHEISRPINFSLNDWSWLCPPPILFSSILLVERMLFSSRLHWLSFHTWRKSIYKF